MSETRSHTDVLLWLSDWRHEWLCRFRGAWLSLRGDYPYDACHALKYAYRNKSDDRESL